VTETHPSWPSVVNFALLLAGLTFFLRKPLRQALFGRREKIRTAVVESERLRQDAERRIGECETKLRELEGEIGRLLDEARAEGERERGRILAQARRMAERILEDAREAAAHETERVKRAIRQDVMERALREATEKLKRDVAESDHRLFVNELVDRLEREHAARG
jgi:F-type H+-transporting ATPase subunit b